MNHTILAGTTLSGKFRQAGIAAAVAVAIATTGCQTTNPYTGEQEVNKTTKGAGIGALGGAIAGVLIGDNRRSVAIGAGIGALAGAGVGNYMDRQEGELRRQLQGTGVSVSRVGDQLILNMPGNITFATNSADISANFYSVLNSVVLVLKKYEKTYVDVVGHTDNTGAAAYNQSLSERRASSVGSYLQNQGVNPARLIIRGMGVGSPIASNNTPEGRAQNRRVEIILTPLT
jgi:outer membrane protein OmpA-like peptidoglycan-associated protein